jgi:hypothetical protein
MNGSDRMFVSKHEVTPTENEDALVLVDLGGTSHFVLTARDADALGNKLTDAAKTSRHNRDKALQRTG